MDERGHLSVCIPVFNGAETIKATLDSVYAQSRIVDEVIVVDNASTDRTLEIVAPYADKGARVYTGDSNIGFNANFNRAVGLASCEYVCILSADDIIYPDFCEKMINVCMTSPDIAFAFCAVDLIDKVGKNIGEQFAMHSAGLLPGDDFIEEALLRRHAVCLSSVIFNRIKLLESGGFDQRYTNSDYILQLLMASKGNVYYSAEKMAAYRVIADCTGEIELYGHADLLTKKMDMLNSAFDRLDEKYEKYRKAAKTRWIKFVTNYIMFAAVRYGRLHAVRMSMDVIKHRFYYVIYPRLLASLFFSVFLPRTALIKLLQIAAKLLGKDGAAVLRSLNTG
jgi:glycosyltransferase involved in cell wall biosynthesis